MVKVMNRFFAVTICLVALIEGTEGSFFFEDFNPTSIDPVNSFVPAIVYQKILRDDYILDQAIHNLLQSFSEAPGKDVCNQLNPQFQTIETDQGIAIVGKMPGLPKEDLSLSISDGPQGQVLDISGGSANYTCPKQPSNQAETTAIKVGYAKFEYSVALSSGLNTTALDAKYYDGLLVVIIPVSTKSNRQSVPLQ